MSTADKANKVQQPAHVPDALVYAFDYNTDPAYCRDPHVRAADLVERAPPIFWTPYNGGHWMFQSHAAVAEALRVAEANTLSLAVLDVNLGAETSLPVAQVLAAQNVPFLLASGYGSNDGSLARYPQSTVIAKPFTLESLSKGLATLPLGPRRD